MFMTYFCYKCSAKSLEQITLPEYIKGFTVFGINSWDEIKSHVNISRESMKSFGTDDFRAFYYYIFTLNMKVTGKEKEIDFEFAKFFLNELFGNKYKIVSVLLEFIAIDPTKYKIKQDTWNNFLDFLLQIGDAFPSGYSTLDSWPTLLDEFYIWYCEKNGIKIEEPEFNP